MARPGASTAPAIPFRIVLWLFALGTVVPFALLLLTSIKSRTDVLKGAFALPEYPHFENYVAAWTDGRKLYGTVYDDVIALKYVHQRYTNYLAWLTTQPGA